ncbi:MAG: hypothetical protein H8E26_09505 [FCB group bacterium]|nr:hypothetical protein [FCB group bacterium]
MTLIILLTSSSFSQNMISKGVWKVGGGVGVSTYAVEHSEHSIYYIVPQIDRFFSRNVGLGVRAELSYSNDNWGSSTELLLTPVLTLVTEKPYWPLFLTIGPSIYTDSDAEELSDHLVGLFVEGGAILFLNENIALIPKYTVHYDSGSYYTRISHLRLGFAYFFGTQNGNK